MPIYRPPKPRSGHKAKPSKKRQTYQQGLKAERWAGWILRAKGYGILQRRYKAQGGEIDLIVKKGKSLVFVEVKFRQSLEEALYAITPHNQARIIAASQHYLTQFETSKFETFRYDILAFAPRLGPLPQYQHLEHAFEAF
ncbi:MAG: YraN family protein [Cohaesibacter sp.]|nr:YraN family protein [Cohaesibacter sp.]MCV6603174.1 YraN family protein [Cohaesibacter sp.]